MNVVSITPMNDDEITFADFWLIYPRREAKKDALKAWSQLTAAQQMAALVALVDWRKVFMARDSERYIPLAASWIRGERWEDELPSEFKRNTYVDQQDAAFRERQAEYKGKGVPMPDSVRKLLASLKGK